MLSFFCCFLSCSCITMYVYILLLLCLALFFSPDPIFSLLPSPVSHILLQQYILHTIAFSCIAHFSFFTASVLSSPFPLSCPYPFLLILYFLSSFILSWSCILHISFCISHLLFLAVPVFCTIFFFLFSDPISFCISHFFSDPVFDTIFFFSLSSPKYLTSFFLFPDPVF